jgi:hypothetical protein
MHAPNLYAKHKRKDKASVSKEPSAPVETAGEEPGTPERTGCVEPGNK